MANKRKMTNGLVIILAIHFIISCLALPSGAEAKMKIEPIEGMSYSTDASLADNLKSLVGKKITVTLISGSSFTGNVKTVGTHLVHLEKLVGKEFYDALIRIENIEAIDARFREPKQ
jgi:hypothetical protein